MKSKPLSFKKKVLVFSWLLYLCSLLLPAVVISHQTLWGYEVALIAMSAFVSADFGLLWGVMGITAVGNSISLFSLLLFFLFDASKKSWLFYLLILYSLVIAAAITNMGMLIANHYSLHFAAYLWLASCLLLFTSVFIAYQETKHEI